MLYVLRRVPLSEYARNDADYQRMERSITERFEIITTLKGNIMKRTLEQMHQDRRELGKEFSKIARGFGWCVVGFGIAAALQVVALVLKLLHH